MVDLFFVVIKNKWANVYEKDIVYSVTMKTRMVVLSQHRISSSLNNIQHNIQP